MKLCSTIYHRIWMETSKYQHLKKRSEKKHPQENRRERKRGKTIFIVLPFDVCHHYCFVAVLLLLLRIIISILKSHEYFKLLNSNMHNIKQMLCTTIKQRSWWYVPRLRQQLNNNNKKNNTENIYINISVCTMKIQNSIQSTKKRVEWWNLWRA